MSSRYDSKPLTLDDVRDWYENVRESILAHRSTVLEMLRSEALGINSRFFGMPRDEIEIDFDWQLSELELTAVMTLMASAEAAIRADYMGRVSGKLKDPLSKNYLTFHNALSPIQKAHPPFDDNGILDALKASGVMENHFIGNFRDSLRLRHWIAHGRYWPVNLGQSSYRPDDIYRVAYALISELPP